MNKLFLAIALVGAFGASKANATLELAIDVGGTIFTCSDGAACDTNPAAGVLQIGNIELDGVQLNGSIQASTRGPNVLSTSSLIIRNTNGFAVSGEAVVSDTDFTGSTSHILTSGAGTWALANGSSTINRWFADAANGQGAGPGFATPGTLLDTFADTAIGPADSYSHDGVGTFSSVGPYSMTEQVDLTLTPGASLVNRGQTMTAVPEPSTWGLLAFGFGTLSILAAFRRREASHPL